MQFKRNNSHREKKSEQSKVICNNCNSKETTVTQKETICNEFDSQPLTAGSRACQTQNNPRSFAITTFVHKKFLTHKVQPARRHRKAMKLDFHFPLPSRYVANYPTTHVGALRLHSHLFEHSRLSWLVKLTGYIRIYLSTVYCRDLSSSVHISIQSCFMFFLHLMFNLTVCFNKSSNAPRLQSGPPSAVYNFIKLSAIQLVLANPLHQWQEPQIGAKSNWNE